jgi:hypothetical protein
MAGKLLSAWQVRQPLTRETAWVCLSANLTLPGFGSLAAGQRISGLLQLLMSLLGIALTTIFGVKFILWALSNWDRIHQPQDSMDLLVEVWLAVRWALFGMGIFALSWLWGMAAGYGLVRKTSARAATGAVPPRLV